MTARTAGVAGTPASWAYIRPATPYLLISCPPDLDPMENMMAATHGFELLRERELPEIATTARHYRHVRTGA
jgi:hypothetical protein